MRIKARPCHEDYYKNITWYSQFTNKLLSDEGCEVEVREEGKIYTVDFFDGDRIYVSKSLDSLKQWPSIFTMKESV